MDAVLDKEVDAVALPVDVAACHAMILQLLGEQRDQSRLVRQMQHQLEQLLRKLYGRSSEKLDPNQLALFAEILGQLQSQPPAPPPQPPVATASRPVKTPHGRRRFPENLPRKRKEHDLPEDQKACPCCGKTRCRIGEEVTEKLEYVPAKVIVLQNVQFKYACTHCEQEAKNPQIILAEKPLDAIDKCMAGPGLLAHVIVGKYSDHLPLHRQERMLARHDIDISRSTMCDWMAGCAAALRPLYDLMKSRVLKSKVIHTDDTPVDVLDKNRKETRTGRFWDYLGDREHPGIVFDYTSSRSRDGPVKFLGDWGKNSKVYLQADAFGGYDGIYIAPASDPRAVDAPATDAIATNATAAMPADPLGAAAAPSAGDTPLAGSVLSAPRAGDSPIETAALVEHGPTRVDRAFLLINAFLAVIVALKTGIVEVACWAHARRKFYEARNSDPARSAQAMAYNAGENALRRIGVGRKNWLFCGSDTGGHTAAVLFSLIATCDRHKVNPFEYLRDVLERIASQPISRLAELLPAQWKATTAAPVLPGG